MTAAVEEYLTGLESLKDQILVKYPIDAEELRAVFDQRLLGIGDDEVQIESPEFDINPPIPFTVTPFIDEGTTGGFVVIGKLGEGGQGAVYRARLRTQEGKGDIALKIGVNDDRISASSRLSDFMLLRGLDHRNLVQVYSAGMSDRGPFIASELVEGMNLSEWLKNHDEPISERKAAEIVRVLASALHAAHEQGVVHCDVKPANIFGCGENIEPARLKIGDFGLSRFALLERNDAIDTIGIDTGGTEPYKSPEQYWGSFDRRSDVYALGVMIVRLLRGADSEAFSATYAPLRNALSSLRRANADDLASPERRNRVLESFDRHGPKHSGLPIRDPRLREIVEKCLVFERNRRYQTAADLAEDLEDWLKDRPIRRAKAPYGFRELLAMLLKRCRDRDDSEDHSELWGFACLIVGPVGLICSFINTLQIMAGGDPARSRWFFSTMYAGIWLAGLGWALVGLKPRESRVVEHIANMIRRNSVFININLIIFTYYLSIIIIRLYLNLDYNIQNIIVFISSAVALVNIGLITTSNKIFSAVGAACLLSSPVYSAAARQPWFAPFAPISVAWPQALSCLLFGLFQIRSGPTFQRLREQKSHRRSPATEATTA